MVRSGVYVRDIRQYRHASVGGGEERCIKAIF